MGTKSTAFSTLNINEPYRATKLWNEIVRSFRADLPRGCHRRRMKTFEDCFVASEAVDWLLKYLQASPYFGPNVSRIQATQLLQKFLQTDLIREVISKKKGASVFEDNKELYRVKKSTPLKSPAPHCLKKLMRTPLTEALVQDLEGDVQESRNICSGTFENQFTSIEVKKLKPEQKVTPFKSRTVAKEKNPVLSAQEVANIWKSMLWNKLSIAVGVQNLEEVLEPSVLNGNIIIHNVSSVQRSGVVTLKDKTDDIPNWIMCAMKCLTKWPNASGSSSCLPNYPGFEKDVFKVIKEYFFSLDEPLIPSQFYQLVHTLYEISTTSKNLQRTDSRTTSSSSIPLSLVSAQSSGGIGNLFTTKPVPKRDLASNDGHPMGAHFQNKPIRHCMSLDTVLERNMEKSSYCYETVFANEKPVTKIVKRKSSVKANHAPEQKHDTATSEESSLPSKAMAFLGRKQYKSLERTATRPTQLVAPQRSASLRCLSLDHLSAQGRKLRLERREKKRKGLQEVYYGKPFDPDDKAARLRTASCDNVSIGSSVISADSAQLRMVIQNPYTSAADQDRNVRCGIFRSNSVQHVNSNKDGEGPRCRSALEPATQAVNAMAKPSTLPRSHRLVKCFQLVLLLIPVTNRRKLHVLLRFLNKIKLNTQLVLFQTSCTTAMLVKMFWKCILKPAEPGMEADETLGCQVVEFLLDHCEAILAPPIELKMEVENVVALLSQSRTRHSKSDQNTPVLDLPISFCEQVTSDVYEGQKVTNLHVSLRGLLEEILTNPLLSSKDRAKKLQKFQKQYPEIYADKFPSDDDAQTKRKGFFKTLKSLRL